MLEDRHCIGQIGDAPLEIGAPSHEIVDLGVGGVDRGSVLFESGLQTLQEGLDGWIHGDEADSRLAERSGFYKLGQIGAGKEVGEVSDTICKGMDSGGRIYW